MALGSNQRHPRFGAPEKVLGAAMAAVDEDGLGRVCARSPIIASAPVGPSLRRYANACLVLQSPLSPPALLIGLQAIEQRFGRRRMGQRWRSRVLDLDLVLWDEGVFVAAGLQIPHPLFRTRDFVLGPACTIAARWRDPLSGLTLRHLHARLTRTRTLPR